MKKIIFFVFYSINSFAQTPGEWTWMNGDTIQNDSAHYGIQGVPDSLNHPPPLSEAATWTDQQGNFWLYGGTSVGGSLNGILWKFDPNINMWTWVSGIANVPGSAPPVYGVKGVASPSNYPGYRSLNSCTWTDTNGELWMFGGLGKEGQGTNDLWKYNTMSNMWTWMSGDTSYSTGNYGTQGVPSIINVPPPRDETSTAWIEGNNLWLFGGALDYGGFPPPEHYNDLWKFDITTGEWTWMKGSIYTDAAAVYGTQGVGDINNTPEALWSYSRWKDQAGNFWMFAGSIHWGYWNTSETWKYSPSTNEWTWMGGLYNPSSGIYNSYCDTNSNSIPCSRFLNTSCYTDSCGMFWMYGGSQGVNGNCLDDLWQYNPIANKWTWIFGDSSSIIYHWPYFGTKEISAQANTPGDKEGGSSWMDSNGNFWLFGGFMDAGSSTAMWRYVPDPSCGGCLQTSVDLTEKNNFRIELFPNPCLTTSTLFLPDAATNKATITVYDETGRMLFTQHAAAPQTEIHMEKFSKGIYIVQVSSARFTKVLRLVKIE